MRSGSLAAALLFLASVVSWAEEYHVAASAANASDDNPGTADKPWRTIGKASATAKAGDVVLIHAGRYPEVVTVKNSGTPQKPIVFKGFGDDEVLLDGADEIPAEKWQLSPGSKNILAIPLGRDPGQVLVDGKPIYVKVDKVKAYEWKLGTLTENDANLYQFDRVGKRLLVNLGAGGAAGHRIHVPVRASAFVLGANCRVAGIRAVHYSACAFELVGDDAVAEDCVATDCVGGIRISGWNRRGVIVRRNTVIGALANGIMLQDRPAACLVEDNLVIRCTRNPWHQVLWAGSIKMNSASDIVFAHNLVLEAGNPDTINGWDGWALWGDINIVRVLYVGNSCAHNKEAGLYIEFAMGDTRAYFNTSWHDGHGITCRASQRGMFLRNYVESPRGSGLAVWRSDEPYPAVDNAFGHNLVRNGHPSLVLQTEHPNFCDYNTYWPPKGAPLATGQAPQGGKTPVFKDLDGLRRATGHELHGEVRDAQLADLGLSAVTFRVAEAEDPDEVLTMIGNGGCEFEDPAGVNLLPYFWRAGTGDGAEHVFLYAAYCGLEGGVEGFAFGGAGGTVALKSDSADPKQEKLAHGGLRYLEIVGQKPQAMCREGLGFWSPSLPARPGDAVEVAFYVRGRDLKPAGGTALAAFVEFTDATGQHRQRVDLAGQMALAGTFGWTQVQAEAKVPAGARRMRVFLGSTPSTGVLLLDDIAVKVR